MAKKNLLLGLGEIATGVFLASPADEAGLAIATGGTAAIASGVQLPVTAAVGVLLVLDGFRRL